MNSKSELSVKIWSVKEIHSVSKTKTLILRDLLFINLLSRFYDTSKLDKYTPNKTDPSSSVSTFGNNKQKMLAHDLKGSGLEDDFDLNHQIKHNDIKESTESYDE